MPISSKDWWMRELDDSLIGQTYRAHITLRDPHQILNRIWRTPGELWWCSDARGNVDGCVHQVKLMRPLWNPCRPQSLLCTPLAIFSFLCSTWSTLIWGCIFKCILAIWDVPTLEPLLFPIFSVVPDLPWKFWLNLHIWNNVSLSYWGNLLCYSIPLVVTRQTSIVSKYMDYHGPCRFKSWRQKQI